LNPSTDDVNFKELAAVFSQIVALKGVDNLEGSLPSLASGPLLSHDANYHSLNNVKTNMPFIRLVNSGI
jgi:hypothetical protein